MLQCTSKTADVAELKDSVASSSVPEIQQAKGSAVSDQEVYAEEEMSEYQIFYLVRVASGYDYDSLKGISESVAAKLGVKRDDMGRIFTQGKGIVLPEDDPDEIYRGEYFPRRFEGNFVSIEMFHAYADSVERMRRDSLRMIVVGGMYARKEDADSVLLLLKSGFPGSAVVAKELFIGCMH